MSQSPENKNHQPRGKPDTRQAGAEPASEYTGRDAADAGNRDIDSLYASASGLPLDDYPADGAGVQVGNQASAKVLARDRNLSGVVRTIQDEGPSDYGHRDRGGADTWQGGVLPGDSGPVNSTDGLESDPRSGMTGALLHYWQGLSAGRIAIYGVLLVVVVILAVIGVVGGSGQHSTQLPEAGSKYFSPPVQPAKMPAGAAQPAATVLANQARDAELREVQQQQVELNERLDDLEITLGTLAEEQKRQWATNEAVLAEIREQQRREHDLIVTRLDTFQEQMASRPVAAAAAESPADSPVAPDSQSGSTAVGDGDWSVNLASFTHEAQARGLLEKLKRAGVPAEQQTILVSGSTRYRLRVTGFDTSDAAKQYAGKIDKGLGLQEPWVSRK